MRAYLILLFHPLPLATFGSLRGTLFHQPLYVVLVSLLSPLRLVRPCRVADAAEDLPALGAASTECLGTRISPVFLMGKLYACLLNGGLIAGIG